ncbi:CUB and sushi domain-containing protein 3 [Toxocara canis]|uniref:CUB and sushi domain-containing protein 3 n=1 Tax=Toxocara canis TaxID=6265 RepID=A0A0B2V013_TOXCA|nr:CUB and sushi domain-containing protein 3 [Toxocara canis]
MPSFNDHLLQGKIIYDPFRPRAVGTLAILLCDIGYVPNGIILTSCGSNGQWSKRLDECKSQFPSGPVCPALTGHNGIIYYDLLKPRERGTWAWLFCSLGHIVNGSAITFCDNNGQWSSPIGSCNSLVAPSNAVRCPELTVSNGAVFYDILKV